MRTRHFIFISLVLVCSTMTLLFMSFQLPQDKNDLQKRLNFFQSEETLDSFIYYQNLLIELLEEENDTKGIERAGASFLKVVLASRINPHQKWELFKNTKLSKAWSYAFQAQFCIEYPNVSGAGDSSYYYLSLLENIPNNKTPLLHIYGAWAQNAVKTSNDLRVASDYLQKAEQLLDSKQDSAQLYPVQRFVYTSTGMFDQALITARKMLTFQLQQTRSDSIKIAFAYNDIASIYYEQKKYDQAKNYYVEAINYMSERSSYQLDQARWWYQLASCYFEMKNHPLETVLYLRKVFSIINKDTSSDLYAEVCNMMALEFMEEGQLDSAEVYIDRAIDVARFNDLWATKGKIYVQKNNHEKAEFFLKKAVGFEGKGYKSKSLETAKYWGILGDYYQLRKKYSQAQKAYTSALWSISSEEKNKSFPTINNLFSKQQAIQILTQKISAMLALYERSKYNVSLVEIYEHAQYNLDVFRIFKANANFSADLSDITILVYEQLIEVCELLHKRKQENKYVAEAFRLAEECKITLLQIMLEEPDAQEFGDVPVSIIQEIQGLQDRMLWCQQEYWKTNVSYEESSLLDWYQQQMANIQVSLTLAKQSLSENYPKYYAFKYNTRIAALDSIQMALDDSTVLVQYLEGKKSIYQFIIQKDTFTVRKIFWRTYKPTILKYYNHFTHSKLKQHVQSGGYKDFCMTAYELYYKLMHHELLSKSKRIVIVPDGLLNYIPFGTLLTDVPLENVHDINFPSLAYLLKKKQIAYNYSSSLWLNEVNSSKAPINNEILGFAATYANEKVMSTRGQKLQNLRTDLAIRKGVQAEIDSLSEKYAGDFYVDRYATEYYFKDYASDYGILHLALYGAVDPKLPEYSSLIFAEDENEEEDNVLTTNEIKQMNLNASMVVLGNCQTAYGPYQRGEGIINLGRSFIYAGSPSVILSLWEQSDIYAPIIMDYFYENLKQKMDKDIALRQAKLRYLKTAKGLEAHPAYWAGFIALGNYQAIEVSEPVTYSWWFVIPIAFIGFLGWWSMQALRQRR